MKILKNKKGPTKLKIPLFPGAPPTYFHPGTRHGDVPDTAVLSWMAETVDFTKLRMPKKIRPLLSTIRFGLGPTIVFNCIF